MGWDGDFASKREAVDYARKSATWSGARRLLAEKSTKQGYYMVVEDEGGTPYIAVRIFEGRAPRMLLKVMDEGMGPGGCTDCPLSFFDLVPVAPNAWAQQWRDRMRAAWAVRGRTK